MIKFDSDYLEGAHPRILDKIIESNLEQSAGYGEDKYSELARELIKKECRNSEVDVHFLVGGTQSNLTLIAAALRPHQGVIAADTGHISVHETGAVEATGHKILSVPSDDGKIYIDQVKNICEEHYSDVSREHSVQPGLVYISDPTELGTIYTKRELEELSGYCKSKGMYLFLDGARLGYALGTQDNDISLHELTVLCDAFYIGGTKVGALFGEAMIISDSYLKKDFRYIIKQRGGLLAKGRLLGLQFAALFEDRLYYEISEQANRLAMKIRGACEAKGFRFLSDSKTNQQFPILPDELLAKLNDDYSFSVWKKMPDGRTAVRICTSWATTEDAVVQLIRDISL